MLKEMYADMLTKFVIIQKTSIIDMNLVDTSINSVSNLTYISHCIILELNWPMKASVLICQ